MTEKFQFSLKHKNHINNNPIKIEFEPGINIIYGESGVGKSELITCLSDKINKTSEKFSVQNQNITENIQVIIQNPDLQIVSNSILNELAFNLECNSNSSNRINQELEKIISNLLFSVDINRHPATLSGGEKELLNISTTLALSPKVILLDDAFSFLSDEMKRKVFNKIEEFNDSIILLFTSNIGDYKYGKLNWEFRVGEIVKVDSIPKIEQMRSHLNEGKIGLDISNLYFSYSSDEQIFTNYSQTVEQFRCFGITGDNGIGKSTLASLLLKIDQPNSGSISLNMLHKDSIEIGFLDQFPEKLLGIMAIEEFCERLINFKKLETSDLNKIINDLKFHNIKWDEVKSKSGLELSWTILRFTLICILANCKYDLLILDEPTFGMGHQQKNNLRSYFIRYLTKKHLILISHDKIFLNSLCDSIINI